MNGDEARIRVVIVDDIGETRENLRKILQFEKDLEVVGAASSGKAGIDLARELKPEVVIMDINMPDMDGITATEMIRQYSPTTQIVILSVQGDPNYMRRAMLAGARDFLTKPPQVDELIDAVRRAGRLALAEKAKMITTAGLPPLGAGGAIAPAMLGKVILVYSPKGGSGATTVAVNLALTLHNEENPVVIVDSNLQFGDVAVFLNEQVRNSVLDLAPRADELDAEVVREVLINHGPSGVKILAAPLRPEYSENVSGEQFAKVLDFLRSLFSYIVVDASAMLTDVVLAAIESSDLIILLTSQEIPAIKNARLFFELANALNIEEQRILFVMNRFDKRLGILPEKVAESLKHEVAVVIPYEGTVIYSVNRGVPFMLGDRSKPIAKAFLSLAAMVRKRIAELSAESAEVSSVSRRR